MKKKTYIQMKGKQLLFGHFKTGFFLIIISTSILGSISTSAYATNRDFTRGSRSDRRPIVKVSHATHPASQMMTFKEGKFTARINSTALRQVMEEFSRLSGINVSWTGPETEDLISLRFANLSPDRAVEKILDGQSYLLFYKAIENGDKLTRVKIISVTSESVTSDVLDFHSDPQKRLRFDNGNRSSIIEDRKELSEVRYHGKFREESTGIIRDPDNDISQEEDFEFSAPPF